MNQRTVRLRKMPMALRNEDGVAIVAVMLILVLLTIIGITSTNVSNTEVQIAGNQAVYHQNFYLAEGAAIAGIEKLEDSLAKNQDPRKEAGVDTSSGILDINTLTANLASSAEPSNIHFTNDHTTEYYVDYIGVTSGSSLGVNNSKVHEFSVYGRDEVNAGLKRGTAVVNVGYLMAFK